MEIVKAGKQHLKEIYDINASVLHPSEVWSYEMLEKDFPLTQYYVALENNSVMGFISFRVLNDECEIFLVCVSDKFKRKKVGTSLVNFVKQNKQLSQIFLEVRCDNIGAINFYKSCGFTILGERKNYYGDLSAYNMGLKL